MNLWLPKGWRGGIVTEFGIDMCTLLYLNLITNEFLLYSIGNSTQCYVVDWMGEELGGEWIHAYVWLSPFTVHLKLSQHCYLAMLLLLLLLSRFSHVQLCVTS